MAIGHHICTVTERARFEPYFFGLSLHRGGVNAQMLWQLASWDTSAAALLFSQPLSGSEAVKRDLTGKLVTEAALIDAAFNLTANIRNLPKELIVCTKQTSRL